MLVNMANLLPFSDMFVTRNSNIPITNDFMEN